MSSLNGKYIERAENITRNSRSSSSNRNYNLMHSKNLDQSKLNTSSPLPPPPPIFTVSNRLSGTTVSTNGAKQLSKLKRFLTTLQQFASDISPEINERVKSLILNLIVNKFNLI